MDYFNEGLLQVLKALTTALRASLTLDITSYTNVTQSRLLPSSTQKFLSFPPHNLDTAARRFY